MLDDLGLSGLIDCIFITLGKLEGLICTVLSFVSVVLGINLSGPIESWLPCIFVTFDALTISDVPVERELNSGPSKVQI